MLGPGDAGHGGAGVVAGEIGAGPDRAREVEARRAQLSARSATGPTRMSPWRTSSSAPGTQMMHLPYQGRGACLHRDAAERDGRHDREPERRHRACRCRHGADHRGGGTAALEGAAGSARRSRSRACRASRPAHGGACSGRPTCRARWPKRSGARSAACSARRRCKRSSRANTMERMDMTPEQFAQFIRDDLDNWAPADQGRRHQAELRADRRTFRKIRLAPTVFNA